MIPVIYETVVYQTRHGFWRARLSFKNHSVTIRPPAESEVCPGCGMPKVDGYDAPLKAFVMAGKVVESYIAGTISIDGDQINVVFA